MSGEQRVSASEGVKAKSVRPALIASAKTLSDYSIFLKHLLVGFAAESVPTALICGTDCGIDSIVPPSVEIIKHPAFEIPLLWRQNRRILLERLEKFRPTILHCLCESEAALARRLSRQSALPYVLTVNSLQKQWQQVSISSKRCARIIVPAKSIAANVTKVYPGLSDRVEEINIGTFVSESSNCFGESGRLASLVTTHPLDNVEDFGNLFRAVKHLGIDRYEFMLVMTGDGAGERQVRKLLTSLGLAQIVTIVPKLELWRPLLAAGDIFVRPRPHSSFDPLLLEAMSVGTAVAGCQGGVDDLIISDKTAVVFDPEDELSIRSKLQQLLDRPELAREIAAGAQQYMRENHSVSNMVSAILKTYQDAQNEWSTGGGS
jgi:glycosyltransferase involved in cell wall biosynthesis